MWGGIHSKRGLLRKNCRFQVKNSSKHSLVKCDGLSKSSKLGKGVKSLTQEKTEIFHFHNFKNLSNYDYRNLQIIQAARPQSTCFYQYHVMLLSWIQISTSQTACQETSYSCFIKRKLARSGSNRLRKRIKLQYTELNALLTSNEQKQRTLHLRSDNLNPAGIARL